MNNSHHRIDDIQHALQEIPDLDGWLFYDFRGSDPLAYRLLHLDPSLHVTRRWYYWIPTKGAPIKLVHRIEPHHLDALPGDTQFYVSWEEQQTHLAHILTGVHSIAMQYSPLNAIPYISRVDAGTIDLLRSFGLTIISSADLVQRFEAVWNDRQLLSHQVAAKHLRHIVDETFAHIGERVCQEKLVTEFDVQQYILERMLARGMVTSSPPIVAVNAHSADPHYSPEPEGSSRIHQGDFILIDLWAKQQEPGSMYADITWTAYVGDQVPSRYEQIFTLVQDARDAAVSFVQESVRQGNFPCGWEVDQVCRTVIMSAGFGERFLHRTGHSIGEEVHGNGANIDNLETKDNRRLIPNTCFSIEPGIYLPEEFGIRSELDVFISNQEAVVFGQPVQTAIIPIFSHLREFRPPSSPPPLP